MKSVLWLGLRRPLITAAVSVLAAITIGEISGALLGGSPGSGGPEVRCAVFISTTGDDHNSGDEAHPFATLERARDYVRTIKSSYGKPIDVCLRGGTYELTRTFELGQGDSGTTAAPITYRAYPGEHVVISGGKRLLLSCLPYKGSIYVATTDRNFNSLFVNGRRATRARTPNADDTPSYFNLTGVNLTANPPCSASQFLYTSAPGNPLSPSLGDLANAEILSMERFVAPRQRVGTVLADKTVMVNGGISSVSDTIAVHGLLEGCDGYGEDYDLTLHNSAGHDRYYVENLIEALDEPGEWYLDTSAHKLYYWPRRTDEITHGEFVVPALYQLVRGGSYPENAATLSPNPDDCRHLGVYPPVSNALSFANTSFTVASWMRFPSGNPNPNPFWAFTKGDPFGPGLNNATGKGGNGYGLGTYSTADTVPVQFFVNDGNQRFSANVTSPQPRNTWIHFAFVVDRAAKTMQAYVSGAPSGAAVDISALGSIESTVPLDIGAYENRGCSWSAIEDFRIYSQALTGAQVAAVTAGTPPTTGLALRLAFDGGYLDTSGLANQTVVFHAPAFTDGVKGAKAADFSTTFPPLDLSGPVEYVGFSDLEFEYTDWALPFTGYPGSQEAFLWSSPSAVYLHGRQAKVKDSRFQHIGSHALSGMLVNSSVAGNSFADVGGAAIKIGQPSSDPSDLAPLAPFSSGDMITHNRINNTGVVVHDSAALTIFQGENNTISQNVVANAPYSGLSVGWFTPSTFWRGGNNKVSLNRADRVMQLLNDGAGLYILGHQPGTVVERNVFHDILETPAHLTDIYIWAIYLDDSSRDILVQNNLTYRIEDGGLMLNTANDATFPNGGNTVTNNIFVDGKDCQLILNDATEDKFGRNIVYYSLNPSSKLISVLSGDGRVFNCGSPADVPDKTAIGSSDYNLFFSPSGSTSLAGQLQAWKALVPPMGPHFDQHSIVADPLFVDYAHDNFTLLPSSSALLPPSAGGIGFKPIDFSGLPPP